MRVRASCCLRGVAAALGIALLALVVAARVRLLETPLERDEGEYGYMGQLINQGVLPYVEAYNMKLPGTYFAYALFLRLFGNSAAAIRLGLLLTNVASIALVFLLARRIEGDGPAEVAAAAFGVLSLSPSVCGPFAHATHFVMLCALAGLVCLERALGMGEHWKLFGGGLLLGLSVLMKQNGAFFAPLALLMVAVANWRAGTRRIDQVARHLVLVLLGMVLPVLVIGLLLARVGAFHRFWFWVVSYGHAYVDQVPLRQAWAYFRSSFAPILSAAPLLWMLALGGLVLVAWRAWRTNRPSFTLVFAAVSAFALCPGFWFRSHYFVLFLPAAALLAATAVSELSRQLARMLGAGAAATVVGALAALAVGQGLYSDRVTLFESSPIEVSRSIYRGNFFPETVEVASYLHSHTQPHERIAVLGSEPQIYFYAQRRSGTGYLYTYPLMEPQPFARRMQEEMIREIENANPAYVVFVGTKLSWLARVDSDVTIIQWANRFLHSRYELVGLVDIRKDGSASRYVWGAQALRMRPSSSNRILVWRRRSASMARANDRTGLSSR